MPVRSSFRIRTVTCFLPLLYVFGARAVRAARVAVAARGAGVSVGRLSRCTGR
nr:hypothetical protein StreXyl84_66200 [Streptomyces sp. Xyl84]